MSAKAKAHSSLQDDAAGYGWISIALHWLTAIVIVTMLLIGGSISSAEPENRPQVVLLHTSIAVTAYALLWARIVWRFAKGHPGPLLKQPRIFFTIGKYIHLGMLVALGAMLVSGPLMVWSGGEAIGVFDWFEIPSPWRAHPGWRDALHAVHATAARVIFASFLLHLGGVYKHAAFDQDGTFVKMIFPSRSRSNSGTPAARACSAPNVRPLTYR